MKNEKNTLKLRPMEEIKFVYNELDFLRAAKEHPEKLNGIIRDAIKWGASNYTIEQLNFIRYGKWRWQI